MPRIKFAERKESRRVSVYMDDVNEGDKNEIAGMLRGLACAVDGFEALSDMDNERFWTESPVIWKFSTVEHARYFLECVNYYFGDHILGALKVKPRFFR